MLDAALELFAERGYWGTRVPEIAKRAGVGAGTIYRYFDSKELLVNILYRREKQSLMAHLVDDFRFSGGPREIFHAFWERLVRFSQERPSSFTFLELHHHSEYLDQQSRELEVASLMPIAELLEVNIAAGIARDIPAPALMALVWGALVGLMKAARQGYLTLTEELLAQAEDACWDTLRRIES